MLAYHFVANTLRDGSPIPANGEVLEYAKKIKICRSGLHASKHPFDAVQYAPGTTLCLVECENIVEEHDDKFVCRKRTILKRFDATKLLQDYARYCALQVVHLWNVPQVVLDFLNGDDSKVETAEAATLAAEAAARAAATAQAVAAWAAARAALAAALASAAKWAAARAAGAAALAAEAAVDSNLQQHLREYFNTLVQQEYAKTE